MVHTANPGCRRREHAVGRSPGCSMTCWGLLWNFSMTQEGLQSGGPSMILFQTIVPGLCDQGNIDYKDRKDSSPLGECQLGESAYRNI